MEAKNLNDISEHLEKCRPFHVKLVNADSKLGTAPRDYRKHMLAISKICLAERKAASEEKIKRKDLRKATKESKTSVKPEDVIETQSVKVEKLLPKESPP